MKNPFHLWLGLPEKSINPNHYQLLGIKSTEQELSVIQQAALERLTKLNEVSPTPAQQDVWNKVQQRILKAQKIISDPEARSRYDKKLRTQLEAAKQKKSTKDSTKPKSAKSSKSPSASPPPSQPTSTPDLPPAVEPPSPPPAVAAAPAEVAPQQIPPGSIPMAKPIAASASAATPPAATPTPSESPTEFSLNNEDNSGGGEFSLKKTKGYRKKKRSYMVPIIGLVLCIAGMVALVMVVQNLEAIHGGGETPAEGPATVANADPVKEDEPKETPEEPKPLPEAPEAEDPDSEDSDPDQTPTNADNPDGSTSRNPDGKSDEVVNNEKKLEFDELVRLRIHFENARKAMYRRDKSRAEDQIEKANLVFANYDSDSSMSLPRRQRDLKAAAESASTIKTYLEGFWKQVVKSAVDLGGGHPLEASGKQIGFVEGTPQYVILRIDGSNRTYNYEFLPPSIALAIADTGAKEDVPTWNLQVASFYAVHTHLDAKYADRAIEYAKKSVSAGHDISPIRNYVKFKAEKVGVPRNQDGMSLNSEAMKKDCETFANEMGIDLASINGEQASQAFDRVLEEALMTDDSKEREIGLNTVKMVALRSGDIRLVEDALDETGHWFRFDRDSNYVEALIEMCDEKLDERRARFLLANVVKELPNLKNKRQVRKLLTKAKKVADKFDLTSFRSRLDQP